MGRVAPLVAAVLLAGCSHGAAGVRAWTANDLGQGSGVGVHLELRGDLPGGASGEVESGFGRMDKPDPGEESYGYVRGCVRTGGRWAGLACATRWETSFRSGSTGGDYWSVGASYREGRLEARALAAVNGSGVRDERVHGALARVYLGEWFVQQEVQSVSFDVGRAERYLLTVGLRLWRD